MKMFIYKDVSKKITAWPFYGEFIVAIACGSITEADALFIDANPQYVTKGRMNSTITVTLQS